MKNMKTIRKCEQKLDQYMHSCIVK